MTTLCKNQFKVINNNIELNPPVPKLQFRKIKHNLASTENKTDPRVVHRTSPQVKYTYMFELPMYIIRAPTITWTNENLSI